MSSEIWGINYAVLQNCARKLWKFRCSNSRSHTVSPQLLGLKLSADIQYRKIQLFITPLSTKLKKIIQKFYKDLKVV